MRPYHQQCVMTLKISTTYDLMKMYGETWIDEIFYLRKYRNGIMEQQQKNKKEVDKHLSLPDVKHKGIIYSNTVQRVKQVPSSILYKVF